VDALKEQAGNSNAMPQARAFANLALRGRADALGGPPVADAPAAAHAMMLAGDIQRFLDRPAEPVGRFTVPTAPPGAPIGEPPMYWLDLVAPYCSHWVPVQY
jgi:hypothetical protein